MYDRYQQAKKRAVGIGAEVEGEQGGSQINIRGKLPRGSKAASCTSEQCTQFSEVFLLQRLNGLFIFCITACSDALKDFVLLCACCDFIIEVWAACDR